MEGAVWRDGCKPFRPCCVSAGSRTALSIPSPSLTPLPSRTQTSCLPLSSPLRFPFPPPWRSRQSFSGPLTSLESTHSEPFAQTLPAGNSRALWAGALLRSWAESWRIKPQCLAPLTGCSNFSEPAGGSRPLRKVLARVPDSPLACSAGLTQCLHPESFDPSRWAWPHGTKRSHHSKFLRPH